MRAFEFINEASDDNIIIDLTPNFQNYSVLHAQVVDVDPSSTMVKLKIVADKLKPGMKASKQVEQHKQTQVPIKVKLHFIRNAKVVSENTINEVEDADIDMWNPERFQTQQVADPIGEISNKEAFSSRLPSCLDMPIKLPGTAVKNPYKNRGVIEFVDRVTQHNQRFNPRFDQCYMYLTVDQRMVEGNKTHRRGGAHFDGMQGERYKTKMPIAQNYIVSDYNPTHLFNQPFDARGLSTKHHNWFHELEKQIDRKRTSIPDPYVIYFVSGYHVHESPVSPETRMRTFMRISIAYMDGGVGNETPNPLLPTRRPDRDREIPKHIQKTLNTQSAPNPTYVFGNDSDTETNESKVKISGPSEKSKEFVEKVNSMFPESPLSRNNRVIVYGEGNNMSIVQFELVPLRNNVVQLKWIQATPLRSGAGSKAMKMLLDMAQEDNIKLELYAWDKGVVSQNKLIQFYKKHGFERVGKTGNMKWNPK